MSTDSINLKTQLAKLPTDDRAELASFLLGTLRDDDPGDVEAAWDLELARRVEEIQSGAVIGVPSETVFDEM